MLGLGAAGGGRRRATRAPRASAAEALPEPVTHRRKPLTELYAERWCKGSGITPLELVWHYGLVKGLQHWLHLALLWSTIHSTYYEDNPDERAQNLRDLSTKGVQRTFSVAAKVCEKAVASLQQYVRNPPPSLLSSSSARTSLRASVAPDAHRAWVVSDGEWRAREGSFHI